MSAEKLKHVMLHFNNFCLDCNYAEFLYFSLVTIFNLEGDYILSEVEEIFYCNNFFTSFTFYICRH